MDSKLERDAEKALEHIKWISRLIYDFEEKYHKRPTKVCMPIEIYKLIAFYFTKCWWKYSRIIGNANVIKDENDIYTIYGLDIEVRDCESISKNIEVM